MAVRKVSHRGGNIIGRFPSLKVGRMVSFESLIERDFIYWLEYEPGVSWFEEQPLTLTYQEEQRSLSYTPDFHVVTPKGHLLVECKPEQFVNSSTNQQKFAAAEAWCANRGWRFQVVTEVQLQQGYRLQNIRRLIQFARYPLDPEFKEQVQTLLSGAARPVTLAELMQQLAPEHPQAAFIPLLALAGQHDISLALDEALLSAQTLVKAAAAGEKGGQG